MFVCLFVYLCLFMFVYVCLFSFLYFFSFQFFLQDTICTASSDGIIRICSVHPNKLLGVVGTHRHQPIEQIKLSRDKKYLAR